MGVEPDNSRIQIYVITMILECVIGQSPLYQQYQLVFTRAKNLPAELFNEYHCLFFLLFTNDIFAAFLNKIVAITVHLI